MKQLKKEEEIAALRKECDERIKKNFAELEKKKEEYHKNADSLKSQLEALKIENNRLKMQIIDSQKSAENIEKKEQQISVLFINYLNLRC